MSNQVTALANNPVTRKQIKDGLVEISNALTRAEAERDLISNIIENVVADTGIDAKVYRKMARTYHKQNFKQEVEENRTFEEFYENVVETPTVIINQENQNARTTL
jgi:hypothetical protein